MIEILSPAFLVTVQDMGRNGFYRYGVCRNGAMDRLALALGNALLGNDDNAAALEIPLPPLRIRFTSDTSFALTGTDCQAMLDNRPIRSWWAHNARAGQVLTLAAASEGCRAYLCVHGGIDVPEVLGSRSTQLRESFGGYQGRMLQQGDVLKTLGGNAGLPVGGLGIDPPQHSLPLGEPDVISVRVLPAAEYALYTEESQNAFWNSGWSVTPQSNRAGYRLAGAQLEMTQTLEMRSHGVVPGVIQVPAGGQPIIQLADAATMGGYPKIGTVIEADLWRIAQARAGNTLRFIKTDYAQACRAQQEVTAHVAAIRERRTAWQKAGWLKGV